VLIAAIAVLVFTQSTAGAAVAPVGLGTAGSFAVLAGSTVTNTGPSLLNGDLGVSPGTAITGFPPGIVNGTVHQTDGVAAGAQSDLTIAYNDAAGRTPAASLPGFIGAGQSLDPGVYKATSSLDVGGELTLNAHGNAGAVFIAWDFASTGYVPIGFIALSANVRVGYAGTVMLTPSSALRSLQEVFGVSPLLGDAKNATDVKGLFHSFP